MVFHNAWRHRGELEYDGWASSYHPWEIRKTKSKQFDSFDAQCTATFQTESTDISFVWAVLSLGGWCEGSQHRDEAEKQRPAHIHKQRIRR